MTRTRKFVARRSLLVVTMAATAQADDRGLPRLGTVSHSSGRRVATAQVILPVPSKSLPNAYLPDRFKLEIGGFSGPLYSVEVNDRALIYRARTHDPITGRARDTARRIVPSDDQWRQFWRTLNEIDIWHWQHNYPNPYPSVMDGTQWSLEIGLLGKRVRSAGNNNYPGMVIPDPNGIPMIPEPATSPIFEKYLAAVRALLNGEPFA